MSKSDIVNELVQSIGSGLVKPKSRKGHSTKSYPKQKAKPISKAEKIARAIEKAMSGSKLNKILLEDLEYRKNKASVRAKKNWKNLRPKLTMPVKKIKFDLNNPMMKFKDFEALAEYDRKTREKEQKEKEEKETKKSVTKLIDTTMKDILRNVNTPSAPKLKPKASPESPPISLLPKRTSNPTKYHTPDQPKKIKQRPRDTGLTGLERRSFNAAMEDAANQTFNQQTNQQIRKAEKEEPTGPIDARTGKILEVLGSGIRISGPHPRKFKKLH